MSNQFYEYLSKRLIVFLNENTINKGDKFYIEFDETEQVENFYSVLKESSKTKTENFTYQHRGGEAFESYAIILKDIRVVVVKNTNVNNDYIVTLRNRVIDQNKEWENTALLVICDSTIDSIYNGMDDLQKGDMPLNSNTIANNLEDEIDESNLKKEEKEITKFFIDKTIDEQFNTTLWEYEEILSILNKESIDIEDYYGLRLFPDKDLDKYTTNKMKKRLEENHKFFDEIKRIREDVDKKTKLENKFDSKGVKYLMDEKWCETNLSIIKKSKESLDRSSKKINYCENSKKTSKEGLIYWERPSAHTVAGKRKRNIIVFNDDGLENITLKFEFDSDLNRGFLDKNSKKFCNISKNKILASLDIIDDGISFHRIKYAHNEETKNTYLFNILVLNSNEDVFKSIKTKYEINAYKKYVKITNDEYDDVIEFGVGLNEEEIPIENKNEIVFLKDNQKIIISEKSNWDEKGKLLFTLVYFENEINFEIIEEKKSQQPTDSYFLWKLKREKQENIILGDTTASLGTDFFILKKDFKKYLYLEKEIISKKAFHGKITDDEIQKTDISLSEELTKAYEEIFNYYSSIDNIPSLTFLDKHLKYLYEKFLTIFNKEIEDIEEKSILYNDPEKLNLLKIGSFFDGDKILLSSLSPINIAFQLEANNQCETEDIEPNIIKRLKSSNLIPFIYGFDNELYSSNFQNDAHEWLIYEKNKEIAIGSTNTFLANVINEKIRHFISHFKFLFRTNEESPLLLNFVNLDNDVELVKGIVNFLKKEIINEKPIKIQISIYNKNYKSSFDEFFSCENVKQVKEKFNLDIKNSTNFDANDILNEIQDKIIFYKNKLSSELNFEYAHISFYNYNSEFPPSIVSMDNLESGLSLNGILSSTAFTKTSSGIVEGFGVRNIENFDNILIKTVVNLNELASNNKNEGRDSYQKKNSIAKECADLDENIINRLYENSQWITFINPNFGLDYFQNNASELIVIHYSDQYSSSNNYDSITVTKKSQQYIKLIDDFLSSKDIVIDTYKLESAIEMSNSINGEWLLKLLNSDNHEQLSIISAIKYGISILDHEDIVWIPISLQEIVRIANTVNLPKNSFYYPLKESLMNNISDSLLFIGINLSEPLNIYYYPIEIINEYTIKKNQQHDKLNTTSDVLNEILNQSGNSFKKKFYRNFLMHLFLTSKQKFAINNIWDEKNIEKINSCKSKLLNDNYIISNKLNEFIGKCALISFEKDTNDRNIYLDNEALFIKLTENDAYEGIGKSISEICDEIANGEIDISNEFLLSNHEIPIQENILSDDKMVDGADDWEIDEEVISTDNKIYSNDLDNGQDEIILKTSDDEYIAPTLEIEENIRDSETLDSQNIIDNDELSKFENDESLLFKNGSFVGIRQNSNSNSNNNNNNNRSSSSGKDNTIYNSTDEGKISYESNDIGLNSVKREFWLLAPGGEAKFWKESKNNNMIPIGWDLGDLSNFNNKTEISKMVSKKYPDYDSNIVGNMLNNFANEMNIGDIVFTRKGTTSILGYGEVISDYYYAKDISDSVNYYNRRKIKWIKFWDENEKFLPRYVRYLPVNTLVNITNKEKYKELIEIVKDIAMDEKSTIQQNNDIISNTEDERYISSKSDHSNDDMFKNNNLMPDERILKDNGIEFNLNKDLDSLRCFIGNEKRFLRKIHWEFGNSNLGNRHLFIQGGSGQGKTYLIQALIRELSKHGIPSIVLDYNHAFDKKHLESDFVDELKDKIVEYDVVKNKFPINPFRTYSFEDGRCEDNDDVAERFSSMLSNTYNLGARQKDAIYLAISKGLEKKKDNMDLKVLGEELALANDSHSLSALSQLRLFINKNPFGVQQGFDWANLELSGQISIIQISNYHDIIQKIVAEAILWDLWNYKKQNGSENKPFLLVLDECQNLNFSSSSPATKIIREGRKFGYSGCFATQNVSGLNNDVINLLNIPSEKIFFNLEGNESDRVSKLLFNDLSERKIWGNKISSLVKGECIVYGPVKKGDKWVSNKSYVVKVTPLNERE